MIDYSKHADWDKNNYEIICDGRRYSYNCNHKSLIIITTFEEDPSWYLSVTKSRNLVIEY